MSFLQAAVMALTLSGSPGGETVLLDFHADWCSPCQQMHPVVDRLAAKGYPVKKINIDQNPDLAKRFGVSSIPCFIMLVDGRVLDRQVGLTSFEQLEQMCKKGQAASSGGAVDWSAPGSSTTRHPRQRQLGDRSARGIRAARGGRGGFRRPPDCGQCADSRSRSQRQFLRVGHTDRRPRR